METNKESDSKEDSVIEAKPAIRFLASTDFKKEKFHGFYKHIQKTIVADSSVDDIEENQNFNEEIDNDEEDPKFLFEEVLDELGHVPVKEEVVSVVKKVYKSYDENSAGDETEDSECNAQEIPDDEVEDEALKVVPEFNFDMKSSICSHVIQRSGTLEKEEIIDSNTTSEEDEAEDDEKGGFGKFTSVSPDEKKMSHGFSEESDVAVSELDYYKIRHEMEFVEKNQFHLKLSSVTLTKFMGAMKSERKFFIPQIKIIKPRDAENDNDTDHEEIVCLESDLMTKEEFLEAHETNYDLTKNQVIFQESHSFSEKSDEESEDEETESIRESIESETEMTDVVFNKYNLPEGIVHTPGCRFFVASTLLTEDIDMIIENTDDDKDDHDKSGQYEDHSEFEKSVITEIADTDYTDEDIITDLEGEDPAKIDMTVIKNTLSPRGRKIKKKRTKKQ